MGKIRWTREAVDWLHKVHDYIVPDKPGAAKKLIAGIRQRSRLLREFPEAGHRMEEHPDENVRILLYGHYRIVYRIKPDQVIDILGVFHGALNDIQKYLPKK